MAASKKPAAKKQAAKEADSSKDGQDLNDEQTEALEEQAYGADAPGVDGVAAGKAALPVVDEKASKELQEKREEIGAIPGARPLDSARVTQFLVEGVEGELEVRTGEGRVSLKGDVTLDQDGLSALRTRLDEAFQAVS